MKVIVSSAANRDLESIRQYTIKSAPHKAVALMDSILDHCGSIADAPALSDCSIAGPVRTETAKVCALLDLLCRLG